MPGREAPVSASGSSDGPRILVVEDELGHAEGLLRLLREEGYVVDPAETAEDAVVALRSADYAVMLLDLELPLGESVSPVMRDDIPPERAGMELLRYLRSLPGTARLPVIVVSGIDHRAFWREWVQELQSPALHVAAIVKKPAEPREIIRELARVTGWQGPFYRAFKTDDPSYGN